MPMKSSLLIGLALLASTSSARAQALANVHIGDPFPQASASLGPPATTDRHPTQVASAAIVSLWKVANGDTLSVTGGPDGRVVYVERDWAGGPASSEATFPGLVFGVTTLADLRARFGSNGMGFKKRGVIVPTQDGAAALNSYEYGSTVVTFITRIRKSQVAGLPENRLAEELPKLATLDAISIASRDYASREWGEIVLSPGYKPIDPSW